MVEFIHNQNVGNSIKHLAIESLGEIATGNKDAINALVDLIRNQYVDKYIKRSGVLSLGKIGTENETAINALVELIVNEKVDKYTKDIAVKNLGEILKYEYMSRVVTALKAYLSVETYNNNPGQFAHCYSVIWKCAQNMTYPKFYKAWIGKD